MNIVVDTNIVFSALISSSSTIPDIIIAPFTYLKFYTSEYLFDELENHKEKLQKVSRLTEKDINIAKTKLFKYITTISLEIIPKEVWQEAEKLVADIDEDDIAFVALSIFLNAHLWTGDKVLYNGLKNKGFDKIIFTSEIQELLFFNQEKDRVKIG